MKAYQITLIVCAVVCTLLLTSNKIIIPAYAVIFHDVTVSADGIVATYISSSSNFVVLHTTTDAEKLTRVNANSFVPTSGALAQDLGTGAYLGTFGCMSTSDRCAVIWDGTVTDSIRVVTSSGGTLGTEAFVTRLVGEDDMYINGANVYYPVVCSGADSDRIVQIWSISGAPSLTGEVGDCSGTNWGNNGFLQLKVYGTKLSTIVQGAGNQFQIWNTGGGRVCTATLANADTFDYSQSKDRYYISTGSGTVQIYDSTCADVGDITAGQHGQSGSIRNIAINEARKELYIVGTGGVAVMNLTNTAQLLQTVPISGDSGAGNRYKFAVGSNVEQFANLASTTLAIRELEPTAETGQSTVCVDTNRDGTADFCFQDTTGANGVPDGIADAVGGALSVVAPSQNVTNVAGTFGCGLGLSSCTNLDVKTNGMGYLILAFLLVFFSGLLMMFAHKSHTPITEVHPILWIILVVAVTGATWQLNVTDAIPFTATIVTIAGIGTFGIVQKLRS